MPSAIISSGPQSSLSSQPIRGTPKAADPSPDNTKPVVMASSGSPKPTTAPTKNEGDGDSGDTPSPTEGTTRTSGTTHLTPSTTPLTTPLKTTSTSKSPPETSTDGSKVEKPVSEDTAPGASATHPTSLVIVHPSNTSTVFTTITSSPESTLSAPSSVPVSINGTVSLTAPPLITVLSTSTQPDGAFVTFTHLVANPGSVDTSKQPSGFLENQGQVAGVFTVVGIVASALVVALVWSIRRHRRRQRRIAWFASLQQYPPSPFDDSYRETQEGNYMRSVQTTSEGVHEPYMISYHDTGYRPRSSTELVEGQTGIGLAGVGTAAARGAIVPLRRPNSGGDPFGDPPHAPQNTPVSTSPNRDRFAETSGASIAPSSPSIYPESLPPTDDSPSPIDPEPKSQPKAFPEPLLRRSLSTGHANTPPRPPRSHLRDSYRPTDAIPLTPPSSHGHSKDSSPETHFPEPFTPRTWLSARTRIAPEASGSQGPRGTFAERR